MELSSERLVFRSFGEGDLILFRSVFQNGDVMRYALMDRLDREEDAARLFEQALRNNAAPFDRRDHFEFAVHLASGGRFIGYADIEIPLRNPSGGIGEIGYFLLPAFWGCGYATEIANTLIEYCFAELGLHRVTASCNTRNVSSEKVMRKAGMALEGMFRKARYKDWHWDDELHYSILKEEWEKRKGYMA